MLTTCKVMQGTCHTHWLPDFRVMRKTALHWAVCKSFKQMNLENAL
ncbi:hypothetical protein YSA_04105 [Pseudomonas putida ND6]|uniref:Uncharacterized protein n=1 Tax=Pseudomonas putida ND6 TaxID=231023 RepID=I3UU22_PSEPU|nr:hypothetical protein YSA_04105 [Pseudomonas putida ND6]